MWSLPYQDGGEAELEASPTIESFGQHTWTYLHEIYVVISSHITNYLCVEGHRPCLPDHSMDPREVVVIGGSISHNLAVVA